MAHIHYSDLAPHAGHTIVCLNYCNGEEIVLRCETCSKTLLDFEKSDQEIWTAEQGEGFTAYSPVPYCSLTIDQRLSIPYELTNFASRWLIEPGDRVRILSVVPSDGRTQYNGQVGIAVDYVECGLKVWTVSLLDGTNVSAEVAPIPTKAARENAWKLREALKKLLGVTDHREARIRDEIRDAYLAIAAAYGVDVSQWE